MDAAVFLHQQQHDLPAQQQARGGAGTPTTHQAQPPGIDDDDDEVPLVEEYDHDVETPLPSRSEAQMERAMAAQFTRPQAVSKVARQQVVGAEPPDHDGLALFALLRPHPTRWWCLAAARANFFLTEQELVELRAGGCEEAGGGARAPRPPLAVKGSSANVEALLLRSGGLQGPLFAESWLLEAAVHKYGRSGFLARRAEAERLGAEVAAQAWAQRAAIPTLPQRVAAAQREHWAKEGGIGDSPASLVNTAAVRWWTVPAALAGFNLRWAEVQGLPHTRYVSPSAEAFDFGVLLEEGPLVALARRTHRARFTSVRNKVRRRELAVQQVRERYQELPSASDDEGHGGGNNLGPASDEKDLLVDSLVCSFACHQTTPPNPSKVPAVSDLVGLKWVTRAMAQELFNLSVADLALLPRLPGLHPCSTGPAGDLFWERDLQHFANYCMGNNLPYGLRRKGLDAAGLQSLARQTVERKKALVAETAAEGDGDEDTAAQSWSPPFARVGLGLGAEEADEMEGKENETMLLERALATHGGVAGLMRYRRQVEEALEAEEVRQRVLRGLQALSKQPEEVDDPEEEEEEEGTTYVTVAGIVRDLLPKVLGHTRWFVGSAAQVNFFLEPVELPAGPNTRFRLGNVYYREDELRSAAELVHGLTGFQVRRLAAVKQHEEALCRTLLESSWRAPAEDDQEEKDLDDLFVRLEMLQAMETGQFLPATEPLGPIGWRGVANEDDYNGHRLTGLAMGVRHVTRTIMTAASAAARQPLTLYLHASPGSSSAQCHPAPAEGLSVWDGVAEAIVVFELDMRGVSPPVRQLLETIVGGFAARLYPKLCASAFIPPGETRRQLGKAAPMHTTPWPLVHALDADWLLPGRVCAEVRQSIGPLAAAFGTSVASTPPVLAGTTKKATAWLPGWVDLQEGAPPVLVTAHPLLVQELLAVLPAEIARKVLAEELQGRPTALKAGQEEAEEEEEGENGDAASPSLTQWLSALGQAGPPRTHALNRHLATAHPLVAVVRDRAEGSTVTPATEWCEPLDPRQSRTRRNQERLGCGLAPSCLESTFCRVCGLCLAQHCGCELVPGAAPNHAVPRATAEQAFFNAAVQQHQLEQEQQQQGEAEVDSSTHATRREEELRRGWESRTLTQVTRATLEDAIGREEGRGPASYRDTLPAHELLAHLKDKAAQKVRRSLSGKNDDGAVAGVLGQLDESALLALGVVVEEAVDTLVATLLHRVEGGDNSKRCRGVRGYMPADAALTLHAHLPPQAKQDGVADEAANRGQDEEEDHVLRAVFGEEGVQLARKRKR